MDEASWWLIDIIGPAILLIVLIWLVIRVRSGRSAADNRQAEQATLEAYRAEDERRRDGTDQL